MGRTVVGIKYELLESRAVPKSERAPAPKPPQREPKPKPLPAKREKGPPPRSKLVAFTPAAPPAEESEEISALKKQVRQAMRVLEEGKPVAAFNLLKRIVED
jgi:hypothetical protein